LWSDWSNWAFGSNGANGSRRRIWRINSVDWDGGGRFLGDDEIEFQVLWSQYSVDSAFGRLHRDSVDPEYPMEKFIRVLAHDVNRDLGPIHRDSCPVAGLLDHRLIILICDPTLDGGDDGPRVVRGERKPLPRHLEDEVLRVPKEHVDSCWLVHLGES
jgi:hypothetical protein